MFLLSHLVETVVLLSQQRPNDKIRVEPDLTELDITAAEKEATYQEIKDYILEKHGVKVSSLYIAQTKEKTGIKERENYNFPKNENAKQPRCPKDKERLIVETLKHFKMIIAKNTVITCFSRIKNEVDESAIKYFISSAVGNQTSSIYSVKNSC